MTAANPIELVSVNVGTPAYLGDRRGKMIESGIRKRPVAASQVHVSTLNIVGDGQADLRVHGGPEKAVYAYPLEHIDAWTRELESDPPFGPGSFGENLTVRGPIETNVCIGDIWAWGSVRLQVCQPRYPCFKLGMATGRRQVIEQLVANGRTGWYFRVLETGTAPVIGSIDLDSRDSFGISVAMVHKARLSKSDAALIERVLATPALATGLRAELLARLNS